MDERLSALLAQLHREGIEHDRGKSDRLERLRNLEPDSAALLALLLRAIAARRVSPEGQEGLKAFMEKRTPGWATRSRSIR